MSRMTRLFLSLCLLASVSAPAVAQEVRFVTVSRPEFGGPLGAIVGAFGGGESRTTTYIQGNRMRVDSDEMSTIYDIGAGRLVMLRHDTRRYSEMSLPDMQQMATAMAAQMSAGADQQAADDVQVEFSMRVERANERRTIDGSDAERFYLIIETTSTYSGDPQQGDVSGKMVVLVDSWRSTDSPIARAMANIQAADLSAFNQAVGGAAYAGDPRFADAMRAAAEAVQELDGAPLLETSTIFIVPDGEEFDLEAAISDDDNGGGPDLGAVVGQALGGALGGLFGGGRQQQQPEPEPEPRAPQLQLLSVTNEVVEIEERVDAAVFQLPEGYTRVEFDEVFNP